MGVNLITAFVQWLTCGNAPATASTVCSVAASLPTSRFNISTTLSVSNLYSGIALSDRMPKDAFSVIRGKTTKGKTALNFKHFESRRERDNAIVVLQWVLLWASFKVNVDLVFLQFIFLLLLVCVRLILFYVIVRVADSLVADRVCVCFYLVNFPTCATSSHIPYRPHRVILLTSFAVRDDISLFVSVTARAIFFASFLYVNHHTNHGAGQQNWIHKTQVWCFVAEALDVIRLM